MAILNSFLHWLRSLRTKIWFIPALVTTGFFSLGLLLISLRQTELMLAIDEQLSYLALASPDTARSVLSTLTGGLISLVVFSFSMVMVVLNQATSQFSPRLLPGLISQRSHQLILGFYLGAILYNLTVMARIGPSDADTTVPLIAVSLAIAFGATGLVLFISFIHAISNAVRIDTILSDLYERTRQSMVERQQDIEAQNEQDEQLTEDQSNWKELKSLESGYLLRVDGTAMLSLTEDLELDVEVIPGQGDFISQGQPLLRVSQSLEEDKAEQLLHFCYIDINEDLSEDYVHGFNQITEIAVKAMSPGINDPATALSAIDYLTNLLGELLRQNVRSCLVGPQKGTRIWLKPRSIEEILFKIFAALRSYCMQDVVVVRKLIYAFQHLLQTEGLTTAQRTLLENELDQIKTDAQAQLLNARDQKLVARLVEEALVV